MLHPYRYARNELLSGGAYSQFWYIMMAYSICEGDERPRAGGDPRKKDLHYDVRGTDYRGDALHDPHAVDHDVPQARY